jgi:hypothetical protein
VVICPTVGLPQAEPKLGQRQSSIGNSDGLRAAGQACAVLCCAKNLYTSLAAIRNLVIGAFRKAGSANIAHACGGQRVLPFTETPKRTAKNIKPHNTKLPGHAAGRLSFCLPSSNHSSEANT